MFSRTCEYAIQAVIYLAFHQEVSARVGLKKISESQDIPIFYLSKILQTLVKANILDSSKGPGGGFGLKVPAKKLTLMNIVAAIEGLEIFDRCGIGLKVCSDKSPCPIHHLYKEVKEGIRYLLEHQTLEDICKDIEDGKSIYVNYIKKGATRT